MIGVPDIDVSGEEVRLASIRTYSGIAAITSHRIDISTTPLDGGRVELLAEGDYGDFGEFTTLVVEGTPFGSAGPTGTDCLTASVSFALTPSQLAAIAADGHLDAEVVNSLAVDDFCAINRHTVMLRYSNPSDSLRFGSLFVGVSREISIPIQNRGSSPLVISAISSSAPQFVPTPSAITVAPRQGITLRVLFTPSSAGSFTGNLRIVSNDPDSPQIDIGLSGQGALPPIVGTTPDSLFASVNEGDGVTHAAHRQCRPEPARLHDQHRRALFVGRADAVRRSRPSEHLVHEQQPAEPAAPHHRRRIGVRDPRAPLPRAGGRVRVAGAESGDHDLRGRGSGERNDFRAGELLDLLLSLPPDREFLGVPRSLAHLLRQQRRRRPVEREDLHLLHHRVRPDRRVRHREQSLEYVERADPGHRSDRERRRELRVRGQRWRTPAFPSATQVWTTLASAPIFFSPWGGLRHAQGKLYGHVGNGSDAFASYDIPTDTWTVLPPIPAGAVMGAAFDPMVNEYVCYGTYGGSNLYRYSVSLGTWSVSSIPFFSVFDGGLAFLSAPIPAIYLVEGEFGTGFARAIDEVAFISTSDSSGTIPPFGHQDVDVRFESGDLFDGTYHAQIGIASNDPVTPVLEVPATLRVIGSPNIVLEGQAVAESSIVNYSTDGARTLHDLPGAPVLATSATIRFEVDGDFGDFSEVATLSIEGSELATVGRNGFDCTATQRTVVVSPAQLQAWSADGHVQAEIQNTIDVNPFCGINRHTLVLTYQLPPTAIDYGELFIGATKTIAVTIRNRGSLALVVGPITSSRPEFSTPQASFTVPPRSSRPLEIAYHPTSAGATTATLTIPSNDPDEPSRVITLSGTGLVPPVASLDVSSIVENLYPGGTSSRTIEVRNTGGSDLEWSIALETAALSQVESVSPRFDRDRSSTATKPVAAVRSATPVIPDAASLFASPVSAERAPAAGAPRGATSLETPSSGTSPGILADAALESVLAALDSSYIAVTGQIPFRFDFLDGVTGSYIEDGGNDMYDNGNFLTTNLEEPCRIRTERSFRIRFSVRPAATSPGSIRDSSCSRRTSTGSPSSRSTETSARTVVAPWMGRCSPPACRARSTARSRSACTTRATRR